MTRVPPRRLAGILGIAALFLYAGVSVFIADRLTRADRVSFTDDAAPCPPDRRDIVFATDDGVRLSGWWQPAENAWGTLVFVHGVDGNRTSDDALTLASDLRERGLSALLFDLRAHGRSEGSRVGGGALERRDVAAAVRTARELDPDHPVGLIGFSLGGAAALLAAPDEPAVRAVIADSPFADVRDMVVPEATRRSGVPPALIRPFVPGALLCARWIAGVDVTLAAPIRTIETCTIPLLLIHGADDDRTDSAHSNRLWDRAPPGSRLWIVPECGHVEAYDRVRSAYVRLLVSYLRDRFQPA